MSNEHPQGSQPESQGQQASAPLPQKPQHPSAVCNIRFSHIEAFTAEVKTAISDFIRAQANTRVELANLRKDLSNGVLSATKMNAEAIASNRKRVNALLGVGMSLLMVAVAALLAAVLDLASKVDTSKASTLIHHVLQRFG